MQRVRSILKQLYDVVPFKQPMYTALRALVNVPEPIYKHLHFTGVITVPVGPTEEFRIMHHGYMIENELFWKGLAGWEKVSMELWTRLSRRSQVILDIGANTGVYALAASAMNPTATVIAVEPVERIFQKLQGNIALNGGRVHALHAAASDHTGTAILYDLPDNEHVLSVSLNSGWNKDGAGLRPVEVPCITVADMLAQYRAARVDLLKIDVETHEAAVLRGFRDILRRDRPSMLIEILNEEVAAEATALLEGLGYDYFNIDDVTWPPQRSSTLTKSRHFNFLICQPAVADAIGL